MGASGSFLSCGEEDDEVLGVEYDSSQGVIKRIPIEVKPRGKLGLKSGRSGSKHKNESLRSISVDFDPDAEKQRKDLEVWKENELANMKKKQLKLETENRKLRAELQTMQKTCKKQKQERDAAMEAENRAMMRAAAIETDRDKIQRQFKIFRETKESELQNLLRAKRELEGRLAKVGSSVLEDMENTSRLDADWWMTLESEPSLASSNPIPAVQSAMYRGPEFAQSMLELDGPYVNINKDDWQTACCEMTISFPTVPDSVPSSLIIVYFSISMDRQALLNRFLQIHLKKFEQMCGMCGRSVLMINLQSNNSSKLAEDDRFRQIERCSVLVVVPGSESQENIEQEVHYFSHCTTGQKPCIYFLEEKSYNRDIETYTAESEAQEAKFLKYSSTEDFTDKLSKELEQLFRESICTFNQQAWPRVLSKCTNALKLNKYKNLPKNSLNAFIGSRQIPDSRIERKFEICDLDNVNEDDYSLSVTDEPLLRWGCRLWDSSGDLQQMEALTLCNQSSCQLGFEKYYDELNDHVSSAGPVPPLLVCGSPGSGKSLLLAKWIELQRYRSSGCMILYHFVGHHTSTSADPVLMIRRLTAKLMQNVATPPPISSDPARLIEEFPKWLEKVSGKISGGIVLVLDSIDRLQKCDSLLGWLTDPLPVDLRVIVSADEQKCLPAWKLWPCVTLDPLSQKNVKDLLEDHVTDSSVDVSADTRLSVLKHCTSNTTCNPLYVVVLSAFVVRYHDSSDLTVYMEKLLRTENSLQLYIALLEILILEFTDVSAALLKKVLLLIEVSRNGITESELLHVVPELTWSIWSELSAALLDLHILTYCSSTLIFKHSLARDAVQTVYLAFDNHQELLLKELRILLKDYHSGFILHNEVTCRTADELPYLCRVNNDRDGLKKSLLNMGIFVKLYCRGQCSELISYWQFIGLEKQRISSEYMTAVTAFEDNLSGSSSLTLVADLYEGLGQFFRDWSLYSEALASLQRALEIRETALDPDHPCIARNLHLLGDLHLQSNKSITAESLYKQSLEIYRSSLGDNHPLVARELDTLAALYQKQGKHEMSESLHKVAAGIRKTNGVSLALTNCKLSAELRSRASQLTAVASHHESAESARTLNELGVLCYLQNNIDSAETLFQRALDIRESLLKSSHPDIAQSLNNLAALYNDRKLYDKAAPLYERALDIRKMNFSIEHPGVVSILKNLGILYKKTGQLSKAETCYRGLVEGKENSFGANHPSVATALVNLAVLCSQQGKHVEAEPLYERALSIYEDTLDPCHPRVSETLRNLALLKYEQGDMLTAAKLYKRASEIKDAESSCNGKPESRRSLSIDVEPPQPENLSAIVIQPVR